MQRKNIIMISLFIQLFIIGSQAMSLGAPTCDALGVCTSGTCPPGMDKVTPPVRNDQYTIRTGDGDPRDDPLEYEPDSIVDIHIRTLDYDGKYIGLLIYAVEFDEGGQLDAKGCPVGKPGCDGSVEVKTGEWVVAPEEPFHCSTICGCSALTHTSATLKRFHHVLHWRAPSAGTGKVIFRAIVKVGSTNGGSFFWPRKTDLELREGRVKDSGIVWVHGSEGVSCKQACRNANPDFKCSPKDMVGGYSAFKQSFVCPTPLFSACGNNAKAVAWSDSEGECFVPGRSCNPVPQCAAKVTGGSRFCACNSSRKLSITHQEPQEETKNALRNITFVYFGVGGLLFGCLLSVLVKNCWQKRLSEPLLMDDLYVDITQSNAEK